MGLVMKVYAIYHRTSNTFGNTGSALNYCCFFPLSSGTHIFNKVGPAKACITSSFKAARRHNPSSLDFLLGLEIIEMDLIPNTETPVYLATFHLDKA